jgi:hypothetical protein
VLGAWLALGVSISFAFLRFILGGRGVRSHGYGETFLGLISMAPATIGVAVPSLDRELARRTLARVDILGHLPRSLPPRLVHEFCRAMVDATAGHYTLARDRAKRVLARLEAPGGVRHLPETARVQLELGVLVLVGALDTYRTDGALHETLESLDRLETAYAEQTAAGLRAIYHAHRGERTLFEQHQQVVDALAARAGSTWRQDMLIARNLWWPHFLCEDVMGLKHCVRQLDALVEDVPSLRLTRDAAHACYLVARGMHAEALERHGNTLQAALADPNELNMRIVGTLARIYRVNGLPERAEAICGASLDSFTKEQGEFDVLLHGARIERVLALFELGRRDEAHAAVRGLLDQQERHDNPMMRGLTHQAAARMALALRNATEFRTQLDAMDQWFRRSDNPSLVAQCYRLADEGQRAGLLPDAREYVHTQGPKAAVSEEMIRQAFGRCRGASHRLATALEIVASAARAERGYLYLSEKQGGLRFAAPLVGHEPPEDLRIELAAKLDALCREENVKTVIYDAARPEGTATVLKTDDVPSDVYSAASLNYSAVYLIFPRAERLVAVGAIALIPGDQPLLAIDPGVLEEVARGIYEAADVQTVFLGQGVTASNSDRPWSSAHTSSSLTQPPRALS